MAHPSRLAPGGLLLASVLLLVTSRPAAGQALSDKLSFVPMQPCRIVDTRVGAPLAAGEARSFNVVGTTGFAAQGGKSGGCGIPGYSGGQPRVHAAALNIVAVGPEGPGHLVAWPPDQAEPVASVLNYAAVPGLNIANGILLPLAQDAVAGADLRIRSAAGVHVVIDAVGYFVGSRRKFYLTEGTYSGSTADNACAAGFHMASMWEVLDPTELEYDVSRGRSHDDLEGPPAGEVGWVRTGTSAQTSSQPGLGNCIHWTSSFNSSYGSAVSLTYGWTGSVNPISPWLATSYLCNTALGVWCVED